MQAVVVQTWYRWTMYRGKFLLGRDGSGTGPATISGPELRTPGRQMQWISGPYYSIASLSTTCTSRLHIELRNMAPTIAGGIKAEDECVGDAGCIKPSENTRGDRTARKPVPLVSVIPRARHFSWSLPRGIVDHPWTRSKGL